MKKKYIDNLKDLKECLNKLRDESELNVTITPEMHTGEQPRQKYL